MEKDIYVITVDEDTQNLIINSLLLMRDTKLKEGTDVDWISDAVIKVCNAPRKREVKRGVAYER